VTIRTLKYTPLKKENGTKVIRIIKGGKGGNTPYMKVIHLKLEPF